MQILFATRNKNKISEARAILPGHTLLTLDDLSINHEVVEDAGSFHGNAEKKAREYAALSGIPTFADDSGLCIDFLSGEPGVESANYLGNTSYLERMSHILDRLANAGDRSAQFICQIVTVFPDGSQIDFLGRFCGQVAHKIAGNGGFGYDPIFFLPEYNCTVAELDISIKNKLSHRARALTALAEALRKL